MLHYTLTLANSQTPDTELTLIAKMRSKGLDRRTFELQQHLWNRGFDYGSPDAVSVPEPLGTVPEMAMWLQPMIQGTTATQLLNRPDQRHFAEQIAVALTRLHATSLPASRRHTRNDELRILHGQFEETSVSRPHLTASLKSIFDRCVRAARSIRQCTTTGIHRDFYADQILIAGDRIYLLDFDLYANGDTSLDAGNFVGHLIEQGIRCPQDAERLQQCASRFVLSFNRSNQGCKESIDIYTILTLARHVALSTVIPGRSHTTRRLIEWCHSALSDH